ncbi:MAG: rRNA pseudouridine synthase [Bacteriovoracaceae bacterium]|nr:rRNA pseudouridine synthase [Bacteriovoracaceae bacterium]
MKKMHQNSKECLSGSMVRLQKYIADCGISSRRKAEEMIVQGRVKINEEIVTKLGTKIDPQNDLVFVDNQIIDREHVEKVYLILHKPRGYVTTVNDPEGRQTVMDLCSEINERIYPVGRLDYLSEGLLILTNDGEVANMMMHPKFNITKIYEVKVFGDVDESLLKKLRSRCVVDGVSIKPQYIRVIKQLKKKTWLEFRLSEGKNREIRKICAHNGITIDKLKRIAIGDLSVFGIAPGNYIRVSRKQLLESVGMGGDGSKTEAESKFVSNKKTINLKKKRPREISKKADDKVFYKFRKEFYHDSIKSFKKIKNQEE